MQFQVNFKNERSVSIKINNNFTSTSLIEVPIEDIITMMHDIADDFVLVKQYNRNDLLHAAGRIISCLEEEA